MRDSKVSCRNSNRIKGCSLKDCSFVHACYRKIKRMACAQSHPLYNHQDISKSNISPCAKTFPHPPRVQEIWTYPMFLNELCSIHRSLGLPHSDYGCHAFCRGRVSFAFQAGIPVELIKKLGDRYSDAVLLYLTVPLPIRLQSVHLFAKAITSHHTTLLSLWVWSVSFHFYFDVG